MILFPLRKHMAWMFVCCALAAGSVGRAQAADGPDPSSFPDAAASGYPLLQGWSYRNMWWATHNANGAFMARGVHGQRIFIDPKAEMVIVRYASHPVARNAANDPTTLPAFEALAQCFVSQACR